MPLAVESLNANSVPDQINQAISDSISQCIQEGRSQKECAGMAFDIAREKTGKPLDFGR